MNAISPAKVVPSTAQPHATDAAAARVLANMHRQNAASLDRFLKKNPRLPPDTRGALQSSIFAKRLATDEAEARAVAIEDSGPDPVAHIGDIISGIRAPTRLAECDK